MKKFKYLFIIVILSTALNVKAVDKCDSNELNRLKELANKVEFKLSYDKVEYNDEEYIEYYGKPYVEVIYKIQLVNLNDNLVVYYKSSVDNDFKLLNIDEFQNKEFPGYEKLIFKIYSYVDNSCTHELLLTKNLKFPEYNMFYYINKDKCEQYSEFKYCKEWLDENDINDVDKIEKMFQEYISSHKESNSNKKTFKEYSLYIYIGIGVVVLSTVVVLLIIRKERIKRDI